MLEPQKTFCLGALGWGVLVLTGLILMALTAPYRNNEVFNIQGGLRALQEKPLVVIGGQVVFAWSGLGFFAMVQAIYDWLPEEPRSSMARAAAAFGVISAAIFLIFGLAGGFASFDMKYIQSVRSAAYIRASYLPLTLILLLASLAIWGGYVDGRVTMPWIPGGVMYGTVFGANSGIPLSWLLLRWSIVEKYYL